ncbi:MAG: NADH:ubiquinone oxidoreductase subunit N, partial [Gammaproteobacteria bacterium]|nr:NADH:ubiquinone oxidoreductase subunit N [Gammaproteobacteria bacterium]
MTFVAPVRTFTEFAPLLPELTVVAGAFGLLMLDLFLDDRRRVITHALSIATLLIAAAFIATGVGGQGNVMEGLFLRDTASDALKFVTLLISALALVYLWPFMRERGLYRGEIPILMLFAVIGMMLLVSAGNLTMIYLGLELLALCSYALVAVDRNSKLATEAGMKYFVLGSLSSGLLLFGLSLIYGATGTLYLDGINAAAATVTGEDRTLL